VGDASIYTQLTEIFREMFADDTIVLRPETTAADVKGWDSFNNIQLMIAVESRFGVRFTTKEIEMLTNVGALCDLIQDKLQGKRT